VKELAQKLWDARVNGTVANLDGVQLPANRDEALQVQGLIYELAGHERLGFKVGSTSKEAQRHLGSTGPSCGEVMKPYYYTSPAVVPISAAHGPQLEGEFAFKLGKDLPARSEPYTLDDIIDAIEAVAGAIEIVGSRIADGLSSAGPILLTADCSANIGLVVGQWHTNWQSFDLPAHPVQMFVNQQPCGHGTGSKALDGPLNVMQWLANRQSATGRGLRRGEIVSTGTCTGLDPVNAGDQVVADFGSLGSVEISFSA
jgi:2-keto-4-pentenoate hydratase